MKAVAVLLVAVACWIWPAARWRLHRVIDLPAPPTREPRFLGVGARGADPFATAAALDLLAVCLRAGLPVAQAIRVAASSAPPSLARPLTSTAELLELGADPDRAWAAPEVSPDARRRRRRAPSTDLGADCFADLTMLARRSARAGSALADGVGELAEQVRRRAHDEALARAERAGVMVSGPLGLCFLPAFICLGIVPVVIGLASQTLGGL
ncbi:type II secretion system F family protein [Gordonia polyisoprenivorans]|uniref:type II secretion system F family protein n=1 Tax=Gordonia polyisoprenivorans TaxID=84595 RepID=UPI000B99D6FC|nr:type II secretion system F family protein [Gordonia polyisoprenivorans]MBE7192786.1 type II secretion system F family protein [Gordonia polyisoprenivorans]OZC33691.1 type II secretion system protein F [Gordonia polyisoprenivorans]UZF57129.1 type II secretion system F family protein [Gordonia polyisoprenivorans]WCB38190.1 type II secretion system F family protein [Gordonia polyisoprenivorans]